MSTLLPPALSNMDGIGCAAVADFEHCEPFRWVGAIIAAEDQARFFAVISFDPDQPGGPIYPGDPDAPSSPGRGAPRYMMVEEENRAMMLCEPCNEMVVCRDNS